MIEGRVFDTRNVRDLAPEVLDAHGRLKVMPASYYDHTTIAERATFGNRHAAYVLPTIELIDWLRNFIAGRPAIEIGAGNGVVAEALGIPATDNRMQERPEIRAIYATTGQPVVRYGENVEELDALSAVKKHKPKVVVACWVTHKWEPHLKTGNMFGVNELELLKRVEDYVFVGNMHVHRDKPLWGKGHTLQFPPWLYSRAHNGTPEFIGVWSNRK